MLPFKIDAESVAFVQLQRGLSTVGAVAAVADESRGFVATIFRPFFETMPYCLSLAVLRIVALGLRLSFVVVSWLSAA